MLPVNSPRLNTSLPLAAERVNWCRVKVPNRALGSVQMSNCLRCSLRPHAIVEALVPEAERAVTIGDEVEDVPIH